MLCRSKPWLAAIAVMFVSAAWADESADAGAVDFGSPVAQEALEEHRGGERRLQLSLQETQASLHHNRAIGTENGSNQMTGNAFQGANGFPVAVQNSGNNVIIQNAFIINLDM